MSQATAQNGYMHSTYDRIPQQNITLRYTRILLCRSDCFVGRSTVRRTYVVHYMHRTVIFAFFPCLCRYGWRLMVRNWTWTYYSCINRFFGHQTVEFVTMDYYFYGGGWLRQQAEILGSH